MSKVVLLVNLGTPNSPRVRDVARYLQQFLSDKRVIDLPWLIRKALLYFLILPLRSFRSAHAYQQVWLPNGSPLMVNSQALAASLQAKLQPYKYSVKLAMRYGRPAIKDIMREILSQEISELIVIPLFPQYSSAATGSALENCLQELAKYRVIPQLKVINNWHQHPAYIFALARSVVPYYHKNSTEHLIISFHGLPLRQVQRVCQEVCQADFACCQRKIESSSHYDCYRAQCAASAQLLAQELGLSREQWSVAFQSRLGRIEWLKPYLIEHLTTLYAKGVREICVISPGFVADCLETIEELGIQLKATWQDMGGTSFKLIPCLNAAGVDVLFQFIIE